MMATTTTTPTRMKKQIHRFLRAARADITALSVYCRLRGKQLLGVNVAMMLSCLTQLLCLFPRPLLVLELH